jgi:hypothetical protein
MTEETKTQAKKEFVDGMIIKAPRDGAPDFVKGAISIKREELGNWLGTKDDEWINIDMKSGQSGKWYAEVNNWKPEGASTSNQASPTNQEAPATQNTSSDNNFVDGMIVKAPRENAPDFVKGSISIKRGDLGNWLESKSEEWINVDIKESKAGKWYAEVNTWKPDQKQDATAEVKQEADDKPATPSMSTPF